MHLPANERKSGTGLPKGLNDAIHQSLFHAPKRWRSFNSFLARCAMREVTIGYFGSRTTRSPMRAEM
jgi:hypothetical protein